MIALYSRVSTTEQAENGHSIDEQHERLQKYCEAMGWKMFKFYTDAGFSGANTDRPALQSMISDIKKGNVEKVLVYKLDRLSRSQKDTLMLIEDIFLANKCEFVSMSENFDTSSPFGRAMIGILSVFAQLEREQIKERMSMGKEGRAKEGKWHGGSIQPIGYNYVDGQLVINEFEAMQVRELHRLFQEGKGFRTICNIFSEKGYVEKYGAWQPKTVKRVLLSPIYIGKMVHNGITYEGQHEPIIDEEIYQKSLAILNNKPTRTKPNKSTYLGGLLYCAKCGARYGASATRFNGIRYSYYCCYSRRKTQMAMVIDPDCKNKNWSRQELDDIIIDRIRELKLNPETFNEIKKTDNSELINKEIAKIDAQISRFMDLYGIGTFSVEDIQSKVSLLQETKKKLENQLNESTTLPEKEAVRLIQSFDDILEHGTFEEIKAVIDALIDRIELDDDDITIFWAFS